ncbi:hypothetical protein GQ54DRAFT_22429 [Martensiomyces pterosporus]|nr:hypothetical protein GQ54DRAFT_22429 [Martensiomyces pterosporus]
MRFTVGALIIGALSPNRMPGWPSKDPPFPQPFSCHPAHFGLFSFWPAWLLYSTNKHAPVALTLTVSEHSPQAHAHTSLDSLARFIVSQSIASPTLVASQGTLAFEGRCYTLLPPQQQQPTTRRLPSLACCFPCLNKESSLNRRHSSTKFLSLHCSSSSSRQETASPETSKRPAACFSITTPPHTGAAWFIWYAEIASKKEEVQDKPLSRPHHTLRKEHTPAFPSFIVHPAKQAQTSRLCNSVRNGPSSPAVWPLYIHKGPPETRTQL